MSKIIGVTVGTPTSPTKMAEDLKPVNAINGIEPDENGNVEIAVVADYYSTTREELNRPNDKTWLDFLYGLYDALLDEHSDFVEKTELGKVTYNGVSYPIYEYAFSPKGYTSGGHYAQNNTEETDAKKPTFLIQSGIHGGEKAAVLGLYRFIRDFVNGVNVPTSFREGATIRVIPVVNPHSFEGCHMRFNPNGVDINRNFDCNWENVPSSESPGKEPHSEDETQIVVDWLNKYKDAVVFIDTHNSGIIHEQVAVMGDSTKDYVEVVKKLALQGIDKVIPYWRDVIGYPKTLYSSIFALNKETNTNVPVKGEYEVIFAYPGDRVVPGSVYGYAASIGIPSLGYELSIFYGDKYDKDGNFADGYPQDGTNYNYHPETMAMTAEVFGNSLIELYRHASEVVDMTETNEKLDTLAEDMKQTSGTVDAVAEGVTKTSGKIDTLSASMSSNMATIINKLDEILGGNGEPSEPSEPSEPAEPTNGFRVETGVYEVTGNDEVGANIALLLPCTLDPKILVVEPDRVEVGTDGLTTYERILASTEQVFVGAVGQFMANFLPLEENTASSMYPFYFGYMAKMTNTSTTETAKWEPKQHFTMVRNNGTQMQIATPTRKIGKYHWKAYYWEEEQEQEPETEPEQE